MSDERHIEKQLRAWAEQRRRKADAPFELHPATRRMLQNEVRKIHGQNPAESAARSSFFSRWRPTFVAGVCIIALVTVLAVILLPTPARFGHKVQNLGVANQKSSKTGTLEQPPLGGSPSPALPPPPLALEPSSAAEKAVNTRVTLGSGSPGQSVSPASPPAPQNFYFSNENPTVAIVSGMASSGIMGRAAQPKADTLDTVKEKAVAQGVPLALFQVWQAGDRIRILDSDGSVYTGNLTSTNTAVLTPPTGSTSTSKPSETFQMQSASNLEIRGGESGFMPQQHSRNFQFVAVGTNLSLHQKIVIHGEYVAGSITGGANGINENPGERNFTTRAGVSEWLSNGHFVGRVGLTNGEVIPLNATPAKQQ
jgi:hypothetical protein